MAVSQQMASLSGIATDPMRNFRFQVLFRGTGTSVIQMGFMSVSGINMTQDVIPYREGQFNATPQHMPGQVAFNPVTLSHGMMVNPAGSAGLTAGTPSNNADLTWIQSMFTVAQSNGSTSTNTEFRKDVDIEVLSNPVNIGGDVNVSAAFRLYRCWPTSIAFSDLDAGANQLFISQMALVHEGWDILLAGGIGSDAGAFTAA